MKLRILCVLAVFVSLVLPVANGASNAHLKATSTDGAVGAQISGTGNIPVMVKPDSLTFSDQLVGTRSVGQMVTFTNDGSADVYFTKISLEGAETNDFSFTTTCEINAALSPGASCNSTIYYKPTAEGAQVVLLLYEGNFAEQEVWIGGTATAVVIKPASLTFPKTMVGDTSAPKSITFTNAGSTALPIASFYWVDTEPYFSETNTCGSSVPADSSCTFSITFSPLTPGTFSATLYIGDPDPTGPQRITVVGKGFEVSPTLPTAYFHPSVLYFTTGTTSTETTTLTNTSDERLIITEIALTGTHARDFTLTDTCGASLAAHDSCTFSLGGEPTHPGRIGELIEYDNSAKGQHSVLLEAK